MATNSLQFENRPSQYKGREARTQSIAMRFTRAEEQALLNGETRTKEEVRTIFQQIQKSKVPGAQDILAKRAQQASQK